MTWTMLVLGFIAFAYGERWGRIGGLLLIATALAFEVMDRTVFCWNWGNPS